MLFQKPSQDLSFFPPFKSTNLSTPYFITSQEIVSHRLNTLSDLLSSNWGPHQIAYSFKTNYDLALKYRFSLAEVVSTHELNLALSRGYSHSQIIFNGPFKGDLSKLLNTDITLNLDNFSEIEQIKKYSHKIKAKIGLRLNSSVHPSRFGFNIENNDALVALNSLHQLNIFISGIHFHVGSDIQNYKIYKHCSTQVANFIQNNLLQDKLTYLDFGGGFPSHGNISGTDIQAKPDYLEYIKAVSFPLKKLFNSVKLPTLILEPGRYLVDDATIFVTKIINVNRSPILQTITVDSTINMLPSTWYRKNIVRPIMETFSKPLSTKIFGCSCQEVDMLYTGKLPSLNIGDKIVFYCVGAYNQSQASSFIFAIPTTKFI